jgi:hypothetical protein
VFKKKQSVLPTHLTKIVRICRITAYHNNILHYNTSYNLDVGCNVDIGQVAFGWEVCTEKQIGIIPNIY